MYLSLIIRSVFVIDTMNNRVIISIIMRGQWNDTRLTWNPADYGGITQTVSIPKVEE